MQRFSAEKRESPAKEGRNEERAEHSRGPAAFVVLRTEGEGEEALRCKPLGRPISNDSNKHFGIFHPPLHVLFGAARRERKMGGKKTQISLSLPDL